MATQTAPRLDVLAAYSSFVYILSKYVERTVLAKSCGDVSSTILFRALPTYYLHHFMLLFVVAVPCIILLYTK